MPDDRNASKKGTHRRLGAIVESDYSMPHDRCKIAGSWGQLERQFKTDCGRSAAESK